MKNKILLWIPVIIVLALIIPALITCSRPIPFTPQPGEVEATEFQGEKLTPISKQRTAALAGPRYLDRETYNLTVDGLVDNPLSLTYADLLAYPQESQLLELECVEGWSFLAKWTGPRLETIFEDAQVKPEALVVIFYTDDVPSGYSSLGLDHIRDNDIIIALKLNDVTIPPERGFPFQVAARGPGLNWAKWVTRMELSSNRDFKGYWGI